MAYNKIKKVDDQEAFIDFLYKYINTWAIEYQVRKLATYVTSLEGRSQDNNSALPSPRKIEARLLS